MTPSPAPYNAADWDHKIEVFRSVDATRIDQSTFEPAGSTPTSADHTVDGHFDPNPQEDEERRDGGVVVEGDAMFFTNDDVQRDDVLRIHFDDTGNNWQTFKVVELVREHRVLSGLIGQSPRKQFALKREVQ